ncbi:MAG TPA: MFS transporter [Rhodoglobus sp.]|jgi:macrolide resistance protein|nr:MAG: MFS transporter [Burkholderiaceae bacterium]HOY83192.1 MFS transporter [Rhodoglobus sp.]HRI08600.1 MFS transporter [Nannocystaceae bacterium]
MSERRHGPLATLLAAIFLFRIGNAVATLALPWFVLSQTKSAAWAGATAASSVIATIAGAWVGGGLVDRFGRAPVALISGVVGGVATASIPLLDAVGALSSTGLIVCVVLGAAFDAPGMAAQDSALPKLGDVAGLSVERVSSLKAVIGNVAILGGPALGGAAIGLLGAAPTLGLTAFCSALAGLLGAWVLPARAARTMATAATLSIRAGVAFLWREPLLRPLFGLVMIFVGVVGANGSVIMPALFVDAGRPVAELGLFSSMMGAGGILGVVVHASVGTRMPAQSWLAVAFCGSATGSLLLSQLPHVSVLMMSGALVGLLTGPVSPILNAAIYNRTPSELLGRVLGTVSAVMLSAAPMVMLAAGAFVDHAGPLAGLVVSAMSAGLVALLSLRLPFAPKATAATAAAPVRAHGER